MFQYLNDIQKNRLFNGVLAVIVLLAVFLAFKSLNTIKEFSHIGGGVYPTNTITVSGRGDIFAVPDIAQFSITVSEEGKTVAEAQDKATEKINKVIDAIKAMGVEDKDIKTTGYTSNPKYEYQGTSYCSSGYCPPGKQILTGYEVSQSLSIKVRKTDEAGDILTKAGSLEVSYISGLNFVVDDMDSVQADAREEAIADAKAKAKELAKSLGVKLVKIVSFNEFSGGYPEPIYGLGGAMMESRALDTAAIAPQLPTGENEIISNVSITYEVR